LVRLINLKDTDLVISSTEELIRLKPVPTRPLTLVRVSTRLFRINTTLPFTNFPFTTIELNELVELMLMNLRYFRLLSCELWVVSCEEDKPLISPIYTPNSVMLPLLFLYTDRERNRKVGETSPISFILPTTNLSSSDKLCLLFFNKICFTNYYHNTVNKNYIYPSQHNKIYDRNLKFFFLSRKYCTVINERYFLKFQYFWNKFKQILYSMKISQLVIRYIKYISFSRVVHTLSVSHLAKVLCNENWVKFVCSTVQ